MKKRFLTKKQAPTTLENATTDELFTELMKRVQRECSSGMFFVDRTTVSPYPRWSMNTYVDDNRVIVVKEVV